MGWVTLTQRKAELKQQHIYYQNRDLQISREKRQMARRKMFETSRINAAQKAEINIRKQEYYELKNQLEAQKTALREYLAVAQKIQSGNITPTITELSDLLISNTYNGSL